MTGRKTLYKTNSWTWYKQMCIIQKQWQRAVLLYLLLPWLSWLYRLDHFKSVVSVSSQHQMAHCFKVNVILVVWRVSAGHSS